MQTEPRGTQKKYFSPHLLSLLSNPLSVFCILSTIGTVVLLAAVYFVDTERKHEAEQLARLALSTVSNSFAAEMGSYYDDIMIMSRTVSTLDFIREPSVESRRHAELSLFALAQSHVDYMQLRYIDASGQEQIRVDRTGDRVEVVSGSDLQNKSSRAYFQHSVNLDRGEIFVSELDLNVEQGAVQVPWHPTLRIATPIFAESGERTGVVVLNISTAGIIGQIQNPLVNPHVQVYLANDQGYWIGGRADEELWGFMFGREAVAQQAFEGEVWQAAQNSRSGLVWQGASLFSHTWLDPVTPETNTPDAVEILPVERWLRIAKFPNVGQSILVTPVVWGIWLVMLFAFALTSWKVKEVNDQRREVLLRERFLQTLIDSAPDAVITIDEAGKITSFSRAAENMFGYSEQEVIGQPVSMLMPDALAQNHQSYITKYLSAPSFAPSATRQARELIAQQKSGKQMPIGLNLGDLGSGQVGRFVAIIRDITEQKQAEADLTLRQREAEIANKAKSAFLANMSHELRTPLNAIIGYSEMLLEEAEDEEQNAFAPDLQRIRRAGRHLLALINDVLDLSKIEAGKLELTPVDFNLSALVEEIESTSKFLADKNNNVLNIQQDLCGLATVRADEMKVRQILFNLVNNACKFTVDGEISVMISADPAASRLNFSVSDTGIGMSEDYLKKLFTEFSQEENHMRKQFEGTGLGLAICKKFVEMMGGEIAVQSTKDKGTTFSIWVPFEEASEKGSGARSKFTAYPAHAPLLEGREELFDGLTVLVVDDDPNARDLVTRYLMREGLQVATASSGREGLAMAEKLQPDAIVLDLMMDDMTGFEVLGRLKSSSDLNAIPVVICSIMDEKEHGIALGAVDYMTKPFDGDQLMITLERHLLPDSNASILIIEDDRDARDIMSRQVASLGFDVVAAENGVVAFERLQNMDIPALILLDLMMPEMNGFSFLNNLRDIPAYDDVPVIVVSAKELSEEERQQLVLDTEQIIEKGSGDLNDSLRKLRGYLFKSLKNTGKKSRKDAA